MKAVLFHKHGGPEVLKYTDFPAPQPKAGEVLIRIRAAVLNRTDVFCSQWMARLEIRNAAYQRWHKKDYGRAKTLERLH